MEIYALREFVEDYIEVEDPQRAAYQYKKDILTLIDAEIERQSITDEDVQKAIVELNNLSYSYLNAETDESVVNINIEQSLANAVDLAITALRQMKRGDE